MNITIEETGSETLYNIRGTLVRQLAIKSENIIFGYIIGDRALTPEGRRIEGKTIYEKIRKVTACSEEEAVKALKAYLGE